MSFHLSPAIPAEDAHTITLLLEEAGGTVGGGVSNTTIHVVHAFEGSEWRELVERDAYVAGLPLVKLWLSENAAKGSPVEFHSEKSAIAALGLERVRVVYSHLLHGEVICPTGLDGETVNQLQQYSEWMGASFVREFTSDVTLLVAKYSGGGKFELALKRAVQIVRPSWVFECWREGKRPRIVPLEWEPFPVFRGCVISAGSLAEAEIRMIKENTVTRGGEFSISLLEKCTHLIASGRRDPRFEKAVKNNVDHVVSIDWFQDSVKRNRRQCETDYSYVKGALHGCVLHLCGNEREREELYRLALRAGARTTKDVSECTHVVAMRSENIPENVHEEVPAVHKEWVEESIAKGMQEPTDEYEIRGGREANEQAVNPLQGKHFLVIGFDDVSRDGNLKQFLEDVIRGLGGAVHQGKLPMPEPRYILADHAAPVPSIYMCSSYEIVSPLWMEMVMKTKRLFDPDLYLGLRPLRVPLPFPDSNVTVAVHGYNGDREQVYRALLKLFGASVVSKDHGALDVLLCATGKYPGTVPCMATTCVSEAWLQACADRGRLLSPASFAIGPHTKGGPLQGQRVYLSPSLKDEHRNLTIVAEQLGATVEPCYKNSVTHFIHRKLLDGRKPSGDVRTAQANPFTTIVPPEWLLECAKTGRKVAESDYQFDQIQPRRPLRALLVTNGVAPRVPSKRAMSKPRYSAVKRRKLAAEAPDAIERLDDPAFPSQSLLHEKVEPMVVDLANEDTMFEKPLVARRAVNEGTGMGLGAAHSRTREQQGNMFNSVSCVAGSQAKSLARGGTSLLDRLKVALDSTLDEGKKDEVDSKLLVLRRQRHRDQWPAGPSLHTKSLRWLRRSDGSDTAAASACEDDTKMDGEASVEFEAPDNRYVLERSAGERADTEDQLRALCQALSKPQLSADAEESSRGERESRSVSPTTSRGPRSSTSAPMGDMELLEGSEIPHSARYFVFSGLQSDTAAQYQEMVEKLGGVVLSTVSTPDDFKTSCWLTQFTHIVARELARSVKILAAIAAGRWILTAEYITKSAAKGYWLNEEDYDLCKEYDGSAELGEGVRLWQQTREAATNMPASEVARLPVQRTGAFRNMKVVCVCGSNFANILWAGGAKILHCSWTFPTDDCWKNADYGFLDVKRKGAKEKDVEWPKSCNRFVAMMKSAGIQVLQTGWVLSYLRNPDEPMDAYLIG